VLFKIQFRVHDQVHLLRNIHNLLEQIWRERERKRERVLLFYVPVERRLQCHTCSDEPATIARMTELCWRTTSLRVGFPRHRPSWVAVPFNSFSKHTWSNYRLCTATLTGLLAMISGQDKYLC